VSAELLADHLRGDHAVDRQGGSGDLARGQVAPLTGLPVDRVPADPAVGRREPGDEVGPHVAGHDDLGRRADDLVNPGGKLRDLGVVRRHPLLHHPERDPGHLGVTAAEVVDEQEPERPREGKLARDDADGDRRHVRLEGSDVGDDRVGQRRDRPLAVALELEVQAGGARREGRGFQGVVDLGGRLVPDDDEAVAGTDAETGRNRVLRSLGQVDTLRQCAAAVQTRLTTRVRG
jgi:hypothetical protein